MRGFILESRNGIHIINIEETLRQIDVAAKRLDLLLVRPGPDQDAVRDTGRDTRELPHVRARVRVEPAALLEDRHVDELGAVGWPKTSGGNGLHVYVRVPPALGFGDVEAGFSGEVRGMTDGSAGVRWSLMPTWLAWLQARQGLGIDGLMPLRHPGEAVQLRSWPADRKQITRLVVKEVTLDQKRRSFVFFFGGALNGASSIASKVASSGWFFSLRRWRKVFSAVRAGAT